MTEEYNQQDGGPPTQPDSGKIESAPQGANPAMVGERSTQEGMAGQGVGQISGEHTVQKESSEKAEKFRQT